MGRGAVRTPRSAPRAQKKGFTLLELLVVISIIALLVSVLLPSLSRAREMAKSAVCLSHLRQLGHGWSAYADDNGDILVPGRFAKLEGGTSNPANWYELGNGLKYRPRWPAMMGKYVGLFAFDQPRTDADRQDYTAPVFACPVVPDWIDERNYAYGYNHQFLGNARKTNGRFHNFPVNRSHVRAAAGTVMVGDCTGTSAGVPRSSRRPYQNDGKEFASLGNHGWSLDPPRLTDTSDRGTGDPGSPRTALEARHIGHANVVFCDAHGESTKPFLLGYRLFADGRFVDTEVVEDPPTNRFFSGFASDHDPTALHP